MTIRPETLSTPLLLIKLDLAVHPQNGYKYLVPRSGGEELVELKEEQVRPYLVKLYRERFPVSFEEDEQ